MNPAKISVVLLTYNGKKYLPDLFASLQKTACAYPWQLIVVDNASTDGTAEWLTNYESGIKNQGDRQLHNSLFIIHNSTNAGFAAGNNVGIRKALADGAEYVVLLNQDTVVDPNWLTELVVAAESDETIGAVQARLMLWDKKDTVNSLGNEIHFLGFGYTSGYKKTYAAYGRHPVNGGGNLTAYRIGRQLTTDNYPEITYASGAAVLYRAKALREVGLFDESLWMYHDDLDLGWRLWRAGWKNVLAHVSVVYHKYEFSRSIKKYYFMERNRFLVLFENYSLRTLVLIAPALVVMELGLFVKAIVSGWGKEKLRAYAYFFQLSAWRMVLEKRKEKQKFFRCPERELLARFTGVIAFQDLQSSVLTYIANPIFNAYWQIIQYILRV
ncbi:MAG: glycosyltransferase family 2 protein [bacterium]|nr:glycosyltransferase family 2 protein [bacterium]MDO8581580.1 glycosyltransferase family 2 protein [bacterium]